MIITKLAAAAIALALGSPTVVAKQGTPVTGTYEGTARNALLLAGRPVPLPPRHVRYVVEGGPGNTVDVTLHSDDGSEACVLHGRRRPTGVALIRGSTCTYQVRGQTTTLTLVSGSFTVRGPRIQGGVIFAVNASGAPALLQHARVRQTFDGRRR